MVRGIVAKSRGREHGGNCRFLIPSLHSLDKHYAAVFEPSRINEMLSSLHPKKDVRNVVHAVNSVRLPEDVYDPQTSSDVCLFLSMKAPIRDGTSVVAYTHEIGGTADDLSTLPPIYQGARIVRVVSRSMPDALRVSRSFWTMRTLTMCNAQALHAERSWHSP